MMRVYRYVPHRHVSKFVAAGWIDCGALVETHHGQYAELMRACACNPEGRPPDAR